MQSGGAILPALAVHCMVIFQGMNFSDYIFEMEKKESSFLNILPFQLLS